MKPKGDEMFKHSNLLDGLGTRLYELFVMFPKPLWSDIISPYSTTGKTG